MQFISHDDTHFHTFINIIRREQRQFLYRFLGNKNEAETRSVSMRVFLFPQNKSIITLIVYPLETAACQFKRGISTAAGQLLLV